MSEKDAREGREKASGVRELEVTDFFDSTGVFLKEKFEVEVQGLVQEVEQLLHSNSSGSKGGKAGKIKGQ